MTDIYIGTVLMEVNRWTRERKPTFRVSDWLERFAADEFSGIELWGPHAYDVPTKEINDLALASPPVRIFNGYAKLEPGCEADQDRDAELALRLGAGAIKYNVGADESMRGTYLDQVCAWRARVPEEIMLLCECHPGTIVETPTAAKSFFEKADLSHGGIIVHPFASDCLTEWFDVHGNAIAHAHLQMRDAADNSRIVSFETRAEHARNALDLMRNNGYRGTYTCEFTAGTGSCRLY